EIKRAADRGAPYHLALINFKLADMDGLALVKSIQTEQTSAGLRAVMMLSSTDYQLSSSLCKNAGVVDLLMKPILPSQLLKAMSISAWGIQSETARGPKRSPVKQCGSGSFDILLVEDTRVNQFLVTRILEQEGHSVTVAENGREAVAIISEQDFDLIFMDVQMPEMNGFEATAAIREKEQQTGAHTPIIAMTAHALSGDRERCIAAGMDDYISKPATREHLLGAIARYAGKPAFIRIVPAAIRAAEPA
ncbi:MAG TPA: response regulator, partial [Blastocatellia bacterium]